MVVWRQWIVKKRYKEQEMQEVQLEGGKLKTSVRNNQ
jgi:hypothetical protein